MAAKIIRAGGADFLVEEERASLYGHDTRLMEKHWTPSAGQVCVDIGFGPGTWTLAALAQGAYTYSFDPRIEAVDLLMRQIILNSFTRGIVLPFALLEKETTRPFSDSSFHWGDLSRRVPAISLDQFFDRVHPRSVDFVNIDAEGSEIEVLMGARRILSGQRPKLIVEIHKNVDPKNAIEILSDLDVGYQALVGGGFLIAEAPRGA